MVVDGLKSMTNDLLVRAFKPRANMIGIALRHFSDATDKMGGGNLGSITYNAPVNRTRRALQLLRPAPSRGAEIAGDCWPAGKHSRQIELELPCLPATGGNFDCNPPTQKFAATH